MNILSRFLLLFAFSATSLFGADSVSSRLPNIILLMGDDHGWEETGYNGHPHLKTPVLDEMAVTGLRLDQFYAAHPSCSPTRGSFLTGRHPNRYGTFTPGWSIRPEEITIAQILAGAGYRCGHFGKWHLGAVKVESPVNPGAMGFHEWLSHDNFFELNPSLSRNGGPPSVYPGESSEVIIGETLQFIDRTVNEKKPFFSVVWFGSPHEPYSGLPEDLALYDDLPGKYPDKKVKLTSNETGLQVVRPLGDVLRERYAEITAMDRSIGQLRTYLADKGLRDNTLVFYCGDNGTSADGSLVTPHRGVKGQIYEGGTLVPGLIEWPAKFPKPVASALPASTSDLLPTLCAITGQPLPGRPLDGIDLMPLLTGGIGERPSPLFFWMYDAKRISKSGAKPYLDPELQKGTTPLVKLSGGIATRDFLNFVHPPISEVDYKGDRSIRDHDFKLVQRDGKEDSVREELFDLKNDPAEERNLIKEKPEIADDLRAKIRAWQESVLNSLSGADYAN
jgi:arylsulfatase A-like enzyme